MKGDLLDEDALDTFFDTPLGSQVIIIHAAGAVTLDPDPNALVHETNVIGTRNIVDQCEGWREEAHLHFFRKRTA